MHRPKRYTCPVCGEEVADLPMPVLKHQLSHVRRPLARGRPEAEGRDEAMSKPGIQGPPTDVAEP